VSASTKALFSGTVGVDKNSVGISGAKQDLIDLVSLIRKWR